MEHHNPVVLLNRLLNRVGNIDESLNYAVILSFKSLTDVLRNLIYGWRM